MARLATLAVLSALRHGSAKITMDVAYTADGTTSMGYMTYDDSVCTSASKCPVVVIIHDWNGMNEYEKQRACMVADMGYVAFAADIYGVDTPTASMTDWIAASSAHTQNLTMYMSKIHGAVAQAMSYDFVDPARMAAIGYCFGGAGLINVALSGHSGLSGIEFPPGLLGVVSYHGGLSGGLLPPVAGTRPQLLVHSGTADDSNEDIMNLTRDLESVSAEYSISRYGYGVLHSFTEWDAYAPGFAMYSPMADQRSWEATERFFVELFDSVGGTPVGEPNLSTVPSKFTHMMVNYTAAGVECQGFVIYDSSICNSSSKCPAVVVIQDWNGMDEYEMERAYLLAQQGYVAFAADIYGVDTPTASITDWIAASTAHNTNASMYMSKIHGAVVQTMSWDVVDTDNMAAIGYCFGGSGLINLALVGHSGLADVDPFPVGLKGVVSFHGGLTSVQAPVAGTTRPRALILAGAQDTSISDAAVSALTDDLESVEASFEITRYGSSVMHSFTHWGVASPEMGAAYDATADFRSWYDMTRFLEEIFSDSPLGTQKSAVCELESAVATTTGQDDMEEPATGSTTGPAAATTAGQDDDAASGARVVVSGASVLTALALLFSVLIASA